QRQHVPVLLRDESGAPGEGRCGADLDRHRQRSGESMTRISAVLIVALLAIGVAVHANGAAPAPNVTLVDGSGHTVRLSELAGNVVLIDFWASWCIPCRMSFPAIDALQRELGSKGLVVVAVNVDEQRKNAESFLAE